MSASSKSSGEISIGLIIIALGGLFLFRNLGFFNFSIPNYIFSWQAILIIFGIVMLLNRNDKFLGTILIVAGILAINLGFWTVLIFGLGIYFLFGRSESSGTVEDRGKTERIKVERQFRDVSIFGGGSKSLAVDDFKGGSIVAIFGGSELNLRNCQIIEDGAVIEISIILGGVTLSVPEDWNVIIDTVTILGAFSNKRGKTRDRDMKSSKTLYIKGFMFLGGGEIKN